MSERKQPDRRRETPEERARRLRRQKIRREQMRRRRRRALILRAVLAGADDECVQAVEEIAAKVGMAFQIQDDILDVISTTEVLGKPVHSDEKNEKMTYVVWKGLDVAKQEVEHLSRKAISDLRALNPTDDYLEILLESLIYREK